MSGSVDVVRPGRVLLIVVDNPAHRVQLNRSFEDTPHHRVFAMDGEDGFDRFTEVRPDLVIAHIAVARLDGTILCQLIRQQPGGDSVPVLLLGEDLADPAAARERVAAVGADAALPLPYAEPELVEVVERLLTDGRPVQDGLHDRPPVITTRTPPPSVESTEVAFGSVLMDFLDQTDEARSDQAIALRPPAITASEVEVPSAPRADSAEGRSDMDTVVSFKNPFFEGDPPTSLDVSAVAPLESEALGPVAQMDGAMIQPPLGEDEPPTPVGRPQEPVGDELGGDQPVTELAKSPSGSLAIPEGLVSLSDTPEDEDAPTSSAVEAYRPPPPPARPDPLEEPKISGPGSGIRPRPAVPGKSQLIREVPRELTPSASDDARASQVAKRAGGQRRGLDESQLGKRLAKRVRTMHRLLDEVDYYQLLGIDRGASQEDLRKAYFSLSLEFHPDRFFLLRAGDLKEKIYAIYRRISEAHRVLGDEEKRRAYDEARSLSSAKRAAPELRDAPPPPPEPPIGGGGFSAHAAGNEAGALVDRARSAYDRGDLNEARLYLTLAQGYERDNVSLQDTLQTIRGEIAPTL